MPIRYSNQGGKTIPYGQQAAANIITSHQEAPSGGLIPRNRANFFSFQATGKRGIAKRDEANLAST